MTLWDKIKLNGRANMRPGAPPDALRNKIELKTRTGSLETFCHTPESAEQAGDLFVPDKIGSQSGYVLAWLSRNT
jgi:hypothetical protein